MPDSSIPVIVSVFPYEGSGQPEQQLAAGGGSIVNVGSVSVFVTAVAADYGVAARCFELLPSASFPWPSGQPCYTFTTVSNGSVYVSPVQTATFPQTVTVTVNPIMPLPPNGEKLLAAALESSASHATIVTAPAAGLFLRLLGFTIATTISNGFAGLSMGTPNGPFSSFAGPNGSMSYNIPAQGLVGASGNDIDLVNIGTGAGETSGVTVFYTITAESS